MGECVFCKDLVEDGKDYRIVAPDSSEGNACSECMADVLKFFKSEKAEKLKLSEASNDQPIRRLAIVRSRTAPKGYSLGYVGDGGIVICEFDNFFIENLKRDFNRVPFNPSLAFSSLSPFQMSQPEVSIEGRFSDDPFKH